MAPQEPLPRADAISLRKLSGEGQPSETKTVLGWVICTRSFHIFLPVDKAVAWCHDINDMFKPATRVTAKSVESLISGLNHVGYIIPHARYFLNRIRRLFNRCEKYGPQFIAKLETRDLKYWIQVLTTSLWMQQQFTINSGYYHHLARMSSQYNTISKISLRNRQYQRIRLVTQGKFLPRCTTTGPNNTETCVTTVELRELTILTTHYRQAQCDCRLTLT